MAWKLTMLCQMVTVPVGGQAQPRVGGWSESVYNPTLGASAKTDFLALCAARAALLPTSASVIGQRYQQVDPIGGSSTDSIRFPGQVAGTAADPATDSPQNTLHCRTACTNAPNVRSTDLRCIPDAFIKGGEYFESADLKAALLAYFAELSGWEMRGQSKVTPQKPIMSINAAGLVSFPDITTIGFPVAVQVLQTMNAVGQRVGGTFKALSQPTTSSVLLEGWIYGATTGGSLREKTIIYPTLGVSHVSRIISRKIGRAFFQFAGRRSKRKRRLIVPPVVTP